MPTPPRRSKRGVIHTSALHAFVYIFFWMMALRLSAGAWEPSLGATPADRALTTSVAATIKRTSNLAAAPLHYNAAPTRTQATYIFLRSARPLALRSSDEDHLRKDPRSFLSQNSDTVEDYLNSYPSGSTPHNIIV